MPSFRTLLGAAALLLGCQRAEPPAAAASAAAPTAAETQQPESGARVEIHGIVVHYLPGGLVEMVGADRWGGRLDARYESIEYLRDAMPVIERSITAEQAAGLRALLARR